MLKNSQLEGAVLERLDGDPRIADSTEIAVSAEGGVVILRGTVQSLPQRRAAAEDALKVRGVDKVDNQLEVNPPSTDQREDDEIRGLALQALIWDSDVPSGSVDVEVENAWVTLKGDVARHAQSAAAYDDVASLLGVCGVTNEIRVNERSAAGPREDASARAVDSAHRARPPQSGPSNSFSAFWEGAK